MELNRSLLGTGDHIVFEAWVESLRQPLKAKNVSLDWLKGKDCLDAGCGDGLYGAAMAFLGAKRVVSVDIDSMIIYKAQRHLDTVHQIDFTLANIIQLPLRDASFDFVFCVRVLHHIHPPNRAVSELRRVLREGGILYLGDLVQ